MTVAGAATQPTQPMAGTRPAGVDVLYRWPVYLSCTLLALLTTYLLGKDLPVDTLNYHLYAGFSALHNRFAQDYFAAGAQSYFNPYAYVPFYALVRSGLSPLEISAALVLMQSGFLWLTYELALYVCPAGERRTRVAFGLCAAALAFANPVLIQQFGSSLADITTAELALAGWLLLARAVNPEQGAKVLWGGVLLGVACALKPTNAPHALGALALLMVLPRGSRERIRYSLLYAGATLVSFVAVCAPWSYQLQHTFGNPLFPLLNTVFRSPEFTTQTLRHFRFIPASFTEALWRPFAMATPRPMVHDEMMAPDPRYAILVIVASVLLVRWLWGRLGRGRTALREPESIMSARLLAGLGCGLALDWIVWLYGSGNSRYFLPMSGITAVLAVALLFQMFAAAPKARNYILIAIFSTQAVQLCYGAQYRWNAVPWDDRWLDVSVPAQLATEPSLYLTAGIESNSFIAPFLASGSGLINFSGGYALGLDGATGARIRALMRHYAPRLRLLWRGELPRGKDAWLAFTHSSIEDMVERLGLRLDTSDCAVITLHGLPAELLITVESSSSPSSASRRRPDTSYLLSCHLVPDGSDHFAQMAEQRIADLTLDRLEDACPELFQPRRLRSEHIGPLWQRLYINTDLVARVSHGTVKFFNPARGGHVFYLGRESDWAKAPLRLACGRRDGQYFARVLDPRAGA